MFGSILVFLLVLSILVVVHELGHFLVAKKNGIWVEEFGFGLPPRIFGKKIGETLYSLNLLPFGGFVKLHGELNDNDVVDKSRAFINKSKKVKTAVIIAGVIMNFVLSIISFAVVYAHYGIPREKGYVEVVGISPDTPAAESKIMVGERIFKVDGKEVFKSDDVTKITVGGGSHKLVVGKSDADNSNELRTITVKTEFNEQDQKWYMGFALGSMENYLPPYWQMPFYGAYYGTKDSFMWVDGVFAGLGSIAKDASKGKISNEVSGPVGILAIIDRIVKTGNIWDLINLMGIISVNLAVINILPFPALDGGRLLFIVIEGVVGKRILPKIETIIHSVGMIILLALILAITAKDIFGLISAGSISAFLNNMIK